MFFILQRRADFILETLADKKLHTTGHKCRPCHVIANVETGLFKWCVLWKCTVSGLQALQNSSARIVTHGRIRDHDSMSRALIGLHCMSVDKRIE